MGDLNKAVACIRWQNIPGMEEEHNTQCSSWGLEPSESRIPSVAGRHSHASRVTYMVMFNPQSAENWSRRFLVFTLVKANSVFPGSPQETAVSVGKSTEVRLWSRCSYATHSSRWQSPDRTAAKRSRPAHITGETLHGHLKGCTCIGQEPFLLPTTPKPCSCLSPTTQHSRNHRVLRITKF